ncbi:hypothetical protein HDV57DRAFT_373972 [Trichoderma longibrachiatum]
MTKAYCMSNSPDTLSHARCCKATITASHEEEKARMGRTAPSALNHLHVMPSESESMERASRQASVKVVRVTVNNHLGDPAKTVSNCAGRLLRLEGCLSCLEECDSSHARVQQSAASQRDGLTLISASRVTAGAPAKACWYLCDWSLATRTLRTSTTVARRLPQLDGKKAHQPQPSGSDGYAIGTSVMLWAEFSSLDWGLPACRRR